MEISIIIPVYNAEKYLREAVESALKQKETAEILLIEDGSSDNSLEICRDLQKKNPIVKIFRHEDGKNYGAARSRNLGIKNSKYEFIAFLDADDFYLENRFYTAIQLFDKLTDIDGVYEAVAAIFCKNLIKANNPYRTLQKLITLKERIDSDKLFEVLVTGGKGHLHLNGLLVKKKIFENCGYFFENLKLHQDSAMFIQMSLNNKLVPGSINKAVAIKRIHNKNRFIGGRRSRYSRYIMWKSLFWYTLKKRCAGMQSLLLLYKYLYYFINIKFRNKG